MKIYISGKITGNPNYKAEFAEAEELIRRNGHIAVNPATMFEGVENSKALLLGLNELFLCDAILMLEGYGKSNGAFIEREFSFYCKKPVHFFHLARQWGFPNVPLKDGSFVHKK
jgi:hypothetical protein